MASPTLAPRALRLGDEELPLFSGAMHYFRLPRRSWAPCLRAIRSLGFGTVESYVPWGVHEEARGRFRFTGDLDLGAFLDEAAAEGLRVLLRPGPHVNAELAWFGLPERVVCDERMQARTGRGTPALVMVPPRAFAAPSYFSRAFLDEVRAWYAAVGEVVGPRLWPLGPVVALQVDNELGHFFRAGAFDGDYAEDALAEWRVASGGAEPPRRFAAATAPELALQLAWLRFKERGLVGALERFSRALVDAGLDGVPRYHNFPPLEPHLYDVAAAEAVVDVAGIDLYHLRRDYPRVRRRALYLAGTSRLPYVPECGVGSFPWGPPLDDPDALAQLLNALMHGVAGANLYMLVERDRWYGSPISPAGEVRPGGLGPTLARLLAALQQAGWCSLARAADVGVLLPRDEQRLALAASLAGPLGPAPADWLGLDETRTTREATCAGLDGPVQLEQGRWRDALLDALSRAHVPFVLLDASAPPDRLARCRVLIVPTFDFLDAALAERLRAFASAGGTLVSGPRRPTRDAAMQQADVALPGPRLDASLLDHPEQLAAALLALCALPSRPALAREPDVDTAVHARPDGSAALLFVASRAAEPRTATVELASAAAVEDVLTGERFAGPTLAVPLAPFEVRLFRL